MRFKIEYLTKTTAEVAVCHVKFARSDSLEGAAEEALAFKTTAQRIFGATGFQIRDGDEAARIVALETFD